MKRKVLAIFCACFMALSLVACGDNTSAVSDDSSTTQVAVVEKPTPEVTATVEPAEEEKPTVTVTDKPEEDKPDDVVEPTEDPAQDDNSTDTDTDEAKPDSTSQDAVTSTTDGTSTDTTSQDTTPTTTDQQPAQETTPTQTDPETNTGTSTTTTNVSGTFNVDNYFCDSNATDFWIIDHQVDILYGSWFIEISTNTYNANSAYISIGRWDWNATYCNINTYSYVFDFGEGSKVVSEFYPGYGNSVSKTALAILPTLVDYMRSSGDPSADPNIPGCTFKPCQSDNPFVQY